MLAARQARPEHALAVDVDAVHAADVLQNRQDRGAIVGLDVRHVVRLAGERVELLAEAAGPAHRAQENFSPISVTSA